MNPSTLNSMLITLFGSALAWLAALYWWQRNAAVKRAADIAVDHQKTLDRVIALESQLLLVKEQVSPFWTAAQAILVKELIHPNAPEMDGLLDKVGPPNALSEEEQIRLIRLLNERTKDVGVSPSERDAALILPAIMARAKKEQTILAVAEEMKLKIIAVAAVIGIPRLVR